MATTEHFYTGNNSTTSFAFTFPYLSNSDVKVELDNVVKTENSSGQTNNDYTINNTNIVFNSAPGTGVAIHIYRTTNVDTAQAQYAAGSSIRAADLNNNQTQVLYSAQEAAGQKVRQGDLKDNIIVSSNIIDGTITSADLANSLITTEKINADAVTRAKIQDSAIDTSKLDNNAVRSAKIADGEVTTAKIADNAVTGAKISDNLDIPDGNKIRFGDSADLEVYHDGTHSYIKDTKANGVLYIDGTGTTIRKADGSETIAGFTADGSVDLYHNGSKKFETTAAGATVTGTLTADLADNSINSEHYVDGSIDRVHLEADIIDGTKLADNAVNTEHITDDAITGAKLSNNLDIPDNNKIRFGNSADLEIYHDGSHSRIRDTKTNGVLYIDGTGTAIRSADGSETCAGFTENGAVDLYYNGSKKLETTATGVTVTGTLTADLADNSIDSEHYVDGSIDTAHIANTQVTDAKLASNSVTTSKITDANVTTDKIANDAITIGKIGCEQTTISNSDLHLPTSGAVVDYVAAQIAPIGGLEVIATDAAFPNTQPQAGVVISIADAGGLVVNGSGTSTTGRTVGGSTVTINNIASNFNSSTVDAGVCFQVSSTGSGQVYNYHKATLKEADLLNLSNDINDFGNRYRVGSSNPTSGLDAGDLFFNTSTQKLLVYNSTNSAWEEAQSIGNFFISTFSESFDGSRTAFTVSNAPSNAQQLIISINGVIQKPNSGTGQPSEGFTLSGSTVTFSSAIPSGSDYFAIVLGSTVNIGAPSNGTVTTDKLTSGAVTTAKIADDAVTGDKIATNLDLPDNNTIRFGTGNDLRIFHDGTDSYLRNETGELRVQADDFRVRNNANNQTQLYCNAGAQVELYYDNIKKLETASHGISIAGNLDFPDNTSGNASLRFGNSQDFFMNHNGSDSYIINNTGDLYIRDLNGDVHIQGKDSEESIIAKADGAVELYYNNSKKFETTSAGNQIFGNLVCGSVTLDGGGLALSDNDKIRCGNGDDLQIYHDGSNSYIQDAGTGHLYFGSSGYRFNNQAQTESIIQANENGAVELYYDNSKKFETTSTGITVSGSDTTGSVIQGDFRLKTASGTQHIVYDASNSRINFADNISATFGDANDLQIYHNGTNNIINDANSAKIKIQRGGSDVWELKSTGLQGIDNQKLMLGNSDDLQIYHSSSQNWIESYSDNLYLKVATGNNDGKIRLLAADNSNMLECNNGGEVELYYNGSKKVATTVWGFQVYGHLIPQGDDTHDLGASNERWDDVYASNGSINTSDKNQKNTIVESDLGLSFVNKLKPVSYKFNNKTRTHYGLIAQDVETTLSDISKPTSGFAGFIKENIPDKLYVEDDDIPEGKKVGDVKTAAFTTYGLRYHEFISPLIKAVQELSAEVETLKTKVAALESK